MDNRNPPALRKRAPRSTSACLHTAFEAPPKPSLRSPIAYGPPSGTYTAFRRPRFPLFSASRWTLALDRVCSSLAIPILPPSFPRAKAPALAHPHTQSPTCASFRLTSFHFIRCSPSLASTPSGVPPLLRPPQSGDLTSPSPLCLVAPRRSPWAFSFTVEYTYLRCHPSLTSGGHSSPLVSCALLRLASRSCSLEVVFAGFRNRGCQLYLSPHCPFRRPFPQQYCPVLDPGLTTDPRFPLQSLKAFLRLHFQLEKSALPPCDSPPFASVFGSI